MRLSAFLLNATTIPQAWRTDPYRRCDCIGANTGEAALVSAQCERDSVDRSNQQNVLRDFPRAIFIVKLLKIREVWNAMREISLGYIVSCLHLLDWIYVCTYIHAHTAALRLIIYVSRELERCMHSREDAKSEKLWNNFSNTFLQMKKNEGLRGDSLRCISYKKKCRIRL